MPITSHGQQRYSDAADQIEMSGTGRTYSATPIIYYGVASYNGTIGVYTHYGTHVCGGSALLIVRSPCVLRLTTARQGIRAPPRQDMSRVQPHRTTSYLVCSIYCCCSRRSCHPSHLTEYKQTQTFRIQTLRLCCNSSGNINAQIREDPRIQRAHMS